MGGGDDGGGGGGGRRGIGFLFSSSGLLKRKRGEESWAGFCAYWARQWPVVRYGLC